MKTTGYEKLCVTVMLCITTNGNKFPPYITLNRKTAPKKKFLRRCNSSGPLKCMGDIGVNGRLVWMCMGTLAWGILKATEYACNGCIS
jgi:hypothetical protein